MASSATKFICLFLILGLVSPSMATDYTVGDTLGWDIGVNLAAWASGNVFHVGDVLHFNYDKLLHNVVRLADSSAFLNCNTQVNLFLDASGTTSFVLNEVGDIYFCSSILTDCLLNLKVKISVVA